MGDLPLCDSRGRRPDDLLPRGAATIVCFILIVSMVNVIMLNVLIAIVSQAQEEVKEKKDETYARLFAETLVGLDSWHPRLRRQASASCCQPREEPNSTTSCSTGSPVGWLSGRTASRAAKRRSSSRQCRCAICSAVCMCCRQARTTNLPSDLLAEHKRKKESLWLARRELQHGHKLLEDRPDRLAF